MAFMLLSKTLHSVSLQFSVRKLSLFHGKIAITKLNSKTKLFQFQRFRNLSDSAKIPRVHILSPRRAKKLPQTLEQLARVQEDQGSDLFAFKNCDPPEQPYHNEMIYSGL
jgi:hypothetical protein